ncbi:hypothetical protein M407DRAFT_30706 [Tulasnella calospora MUT 4182]|uniref:Ubiquitin-like protease family profile domain-containing protein n=1 Tax=Tulasnella calospora MUT 4182 TaxID=1051891 RepID=A0A0C3PX42_9AGAM|nr:hypothetical protein M407DRAFT_30706 [Tulasnella calospora MUT 4182]
MLQHFTTTTTHGTHLTFTPHTTQLPFQDAMSRLNTEVIPDPTATSSNKTKQAADGTSERQAPKNWTFINFRPHAPQGTPIDSLAITSGYGDGDTTSIHREALPRLDKGSWLVTSLVDFHCHEVGNVCYESNGKFTNAVRIDPKASPLDHNYVAFPMNARESHWALGILTHASDLLEEHNPSGPIHTSLLVLNSIHGYNPRDLDKRYRDFIRLLSMGKKFRKGAISRVKLFKPEVLQQPNGTDCGLYPGHFLSVFLTNPARYEAICKGERAAGESIDDLWHGDRVLHARDNLRDLVERVCIVRQAAHSFHSGRTPADLGLEY